MNRPLPILAILLGAAGLLPFLGAGLAALGPQPQGDRAMMALVAYGAVILSFLGGVHWGFALQDSADRGQRQRLLLGVAPSLVGWVALLLAMAIQTEAGVALLAAGVLGTTIVEARAQRAGLMPRGYMALRYGLSGVVIVVLVVVVFLRLINAHITLW